MNKIQAKSILNKHKKRDDWFLDDYSLNPYQACPFNCIYCYIRGSKYGENMAKTFSVKMNAPELLEKELSRRAKKNQHGIIFIAGTTDPYPQQELEVKMTRGLLEIILKYKFPVHVQTKSVFIERDFDLLRRIDKEAILPEDLKELRRGVIISFSFSSLDEKLRKIFEPGAFPVEERLETMKKCVQNGFLTGAVFIPVLPYISDTDEKLEEMVKTAKNYGANFVLVGSLTLFGNGPADCKTLYYKVLEGHFPELVPKYKSLFGNFFAPPRGYRERLEEKSKSLCEKYVIKYGIL